MSLFFKTIYRCTKAPTLHFFYHIVTDEPAPHVQHLYPVRGVRQFEADLEWILRHFTPLALEEMTSHPNYKKPGFHLSFDDGLRQCSDTIKPILLQKGIPATFFINPTFVDNTALMYRYKASLLANAHPALLSQLLQIPYHEQTKLDELADRHGVDFDAFLRQYRPYMTHSQITDLQEHGFGIGAHSMDHPLYYQLDPKAQIRQTLDSIAYIRQEWGIPYPPFAFPFTDFGVPSAFFQHLPINTLSFGCAGIKNDQQRNHFQRLAIEKTTQSAEQTIKKAYWAYLAKTMIGRHIARR